MNRRANSFGIDWAAQWEAHSPLRREGAFILDLAPYGAPSQEVRLLPGGGFGDLSHPTTSLTLELLAPYAKGAVFIDIGCGSGILSLAALKLGALKAYALDIEPEARDHCRENARHNELLPLLTISSHLNEPPSGEGPLLIAMNMIHSEQRCAWISNPLIHNRQTTLITSGILASDRGAYLEKPPFSSYSLQCTTSKEGWSAFLFVN